MIIDGIRTPRIRIPKALVGLRVRDWPGALALEGKTAALVWKLAGAAIRRWSLASEQAFYKMGVADSPGAFEANRWRAVQALDRLAVGFTGAGLTIDDLIGWAQIEVEFQEHLPRGTEEIEAAKRDWTR